MPTTVTTSNLTKTPKSVDGYQVGQSSSDLVGFYGATPAARPSVANLTGTLTGSTNGTMEDAPAVTAAGGEATAAELTAVNTSITSVNLNMKELKVKLDELIDDLQSVGLIG